MDVFSIHNSVMQNYRSFIESFINISDEAIRKKVEEELSSGKLWPAPLIQFNPSYEEVGYIDELVAKENLRPELNDIFKDYRLYRHQVEAIRLGLQCKDFIVTSGTGSGKSLTFMGTIFNHILEQAIDKKGIRAIIVYPMNALINSQTGELTKYKDNYEKCTGKEFPIKFAQYTGQENQDRREQIRREEPHIILTNYMMLELLLTRIKEKPLRESFFKNLRYLVFDELHTYRGRQGADVGMLIRRISAKAKHKLTFIGTSATMISGGTIHEQKQSVAVVASKLFGRKFGPEQIIQETLCPCFHFHDKLPSSEELRLSIKNDIDLKADVDKLSVHPTVIWLENKIALKEKEGKLVRNLPLRFQQIARKLSEDSGETLDKCESHLINVLNWITQVNIRHSGSHYTYLPFRLHQFLSQTGSVYTTLDRDDSREITLEPGPFIVKGDEKKQLYPNVFSRYSGHPFICVTLNPANHVLEPRKFKMKTDERDKEEPIYLDGYLIVGEDIWNPDADLEQLPDSWLRFNKEGLITKILKGYEKRVPQKIFYDEKGKFSFTKPMKYKAWYMPAPLLFDPTSGTFFEGKTSEGTKLASLGSEGRSSSTTLLSLSILRQLSEIGYDKKDQKILSFTDNRQDAALQAGHFNDMLDTIQLRAAIYKALLAAPGNTLTYKSLGQAIFDALDLSMLEYANTAAEPVPWKAKKYEETFKKYLMYRALYDLKRSWRINVPNLEQSALLEMGYDHIKEVVEYETLWEDFPILKDLDKKKRSDFLFQVLEYFRHSYALSSELYLQPTTIDENHKEIVENLKRPWKFEREDKIEQPRVMRLEPLDSKCRLSNESAGPQSRLGKYVKWFISQNFPGQTLKTKEYQDFMQILLDKLEAADFLTSQTARNKNNEEIKVYQLRLDSIIWKIGYKKNVQPDIVRSRSYKNTVIPANTFYQELYQIDFSKVKRLLGEDHTGQLQNADRQDREEKFREGLINALFCSPTMELGIDIKELSIVHMRNVPPNPANYAQRSGRAGRSGQAALVFTYCSSYSAHDRHYFKEQTDMVAGAVAPPRLDLINKELLETHLNALYLSHVGLDELDRSIMDLIDEISPKLPLSDTIRTKLHITNKQHADIREMFKKVISDFKNDLNSITAPWFTDQWVEHVITNFTNKLDISINRWRNLYISADRLLKKSSDELSSGLYKSKSKEYKQATVNLHQATRQRELLRNEGFEAGGQFSEFYPYRYFASEAFLPGYNFPHLPLRTFVAIGNGGEFISRSRNIALREFGPQNIIYHKGAKYIIKQMIAQDIENRIFKAKVSKSSGYFLTGEQYSVDTCPLTKVSLSDNDTKEDLINLLEMAETRCIETARITCEEEERLSRGYKIDTYFAVDGDLSRTTKATLKSHDEPLINLTFIPAARIYSVNQGWRVKKREGFIIGLTTGLWHKESKLTDNDKNGEDINLVKLVISNTSDALYLEPMSALGLEADGIITLQFAIKRAIERRFHVESNEISVTIMGDPKAPNIFLYESAEGSLGILSQFVQNISVFHEVVNDAIKICRFDETEYTRPASYDDLLSYYNQYYHQIIDRFLIKNALDKLRVCKIELQTNKHFDNYDHHYQKLLTRIDPNSSTERVFLDYLYKNNLRLPDEAQKSYKDMYIQPDFFYKPDIWVFCDGTPHDDPKIKEDDRIKRQAIINDGEQIVVYYYKDNLDKLVTVRSDIFTKVR